MSIVNASEKPAPPEAAEAEVAHVASSHRHPFHKAGGAAGGAIAGAAVGSIAGPAGAAAGAVIGGVVGAFVAKIADEEAERVSFHDGELDAEIGVNGGDLGAPNLEHPPAIRGTYSAGSSGGGGGDSGRTSSGPMQVPEK